ncbi:FSD1-like protein isoform X3 [Acanthochromis polyacanthus]|uniref:FSD1-like protein isoform X3 n=1 Tax=Acanthochromis polyacanthus TaxID=80966 RepID=UPI002233E6A9|nr:FSD1-like protein isoform X3 [Acanthochromis polyacanthus]
MDTQKEALRRIISTLANKNDELQNFLETVENTVTGLQEESYKVMSDLEAELEQLRSVLEEKGAELRHIIKEEQQRKEAELQQLSEGKFALLSCEELREFANQTLTITNEEEFLTAAKQIKERVTMAPAFRLTTRPAVSDNMSQFTVDFSTERAGLQRLHFLPVPRAPEIDLSNCVVRDNAITVAWQPLGDADSDGGSGPIERYELEYRKTNRDSSRAAGEACWEKICDIRETQVTISGLKFDSPFVVVRVRARNKAAAGDFSEPIAMETKAFNFGFDAVTAHAELKVHGDSVTWEPQGVKGHDPRLRAKDNKSSRSATPSPNKTAASRAGRDRFAGESYTVLGDQEMTGGSYYWELRPLADWKSFSVGVAYRASLGRFDQLGKGAGSWCLSASQWLQTSLAAKHNNRAKALDWPLPQRIGIYCDYDNGDLMFVDVDQLRLLHSFKTKFSQPLVPAFTVWCGGITVATGLQVPSFMGKFASTNQSLSSLTQ